MSWWEHYRGLPFTDRGRNLEGVDCWGLAVLIHGRHLGAVLPDRPEISSLDGIAVNQAARDGLAAGPWQEIAAGYEQSFDLMIVWRPYRDAQGGTRMGPIHCGVVTRKGFVLHADEDTGVVEVPYAPEPHWSLHSRRFQFYRWQGDTA